MDLFNEKALAEEIQPVLQAVAISVVDRATEKIIPELTREITAALDGLTVDVTIRIRPKA